MASHLLRFSLWAGQFSFYWPSKKFQDKIFSVFLLKLTEFLLHKNPKVSDSWCELVCKPNSERSEFPISLTLQVSFFCPTWDTYCWPYASWLLPAWGRPFPHAVDVSVKRLRCCRQGDSNPCLYHNTFDHLHLSIQIQGTKANEIFLIERKDWKQVTRSLFPANLNLK